MSIIEEENVKLVQNGKIAEITINRPKTLNALNADVLQGLILALGKLIRSADTKVVVITGAGEKSFVAGADISGMSQLGPRAIADYVELGQRVMRTIETAPMPVIAAVNGYALGGGLELALACDIIIASKNAKFGQPEVNLGIIPGFGGTQRLIQRCGIGQARLLCFTGDLISTEEALRIGLIDRVVEPNDLLSSVQALAENIASKAPLAVSAAKRIIRQSQETILNSGLRLEVEAFLDLFQTVDREEGMSAFMQKRAAKFIGK